MTNGSLHMRQGTRGFTLIELMIAVVVIGVLAAIAVPAYRAFGNDARESEAYPALRLVHQLQEVERHRSGEYSNRFDQLGDDRLRLRSVECYGFGIASDGDTFTACAAPRELSVLRSFQVDPSGQITEIDASACTVSTVE